MKLKLLSKLKKSVNHYIDKLARENEKSFGNTTLDCCELNKKNK